MPKRILQLILCSAICMIMMVGSGAALTSADHGVTGSSSNAETNTTTGNDDQTHDLVHGTSGNVKITTPTTHTETKTETETSSDNQSQSGHELSQTRLHVCENRQHLINGITGRIVTRGTNQLNLFTTIAQRVETFKTSHNLTVANYDQLVAAIQADQSKVNSDLTTMKTNETLECTGDPQGVASAFQTALKTEISDLKTYKTDVKNLITAVKTATEANRTTSQTMTGGNQ